MDSDILFTQVYRVGGDEQRASMRTGIVRRVDSIKGLIDVEVAGELLRDVPYAAGLSPKIGATVWLIEQGSWFAAVSASASSGQASAGADEVIVGGEPPTQVSVDLWVDTATDGTGDGWAALDERYVERDGSSMTGPLLLSGDPVDPLQAVPLRFLAAHGGAEEVHIGPEEPENPSVELWVDTRGTRLTQAELFDSPVGAVVGFATLDSPTGWLLCDGRAIPTQYEALIALVGPRTPDLRDRFIIGAGGSHGVGDQGGAASVTLTEAQMPSHAHRTGISGSVAHAAVDGGATAQVLFDQNTGVLTATAGGGQAHENRPPFHALAYHIRAVEVAPGDGGITVTEADKRFVNLTGDAMTGPLALPADPVKPLEAATKQYVDAHTGGGGGNGNEVEVSTTEPTDPRVEWWVNPNGAAGGGGGGGGGTGEPNVGAPIGTVVSYVGSVVPEGWHLCDGTPHGSAPLEALIGSPNAPDLRGRFLLAASAGHAAGSTGGAETHTLTEAEMPHHTHGMGVESADHFHSGQTGGQSNSHAHALQRTTAGGAQGALAYLIGAQGDFGVQDGTHGADSDHSHGFSTGGRSAVHVHGIYGTGGGGAHNNMPPFYAIVFIIKTFTDAVAEHGFTREEATAQFVNSSGDTMTGPLRLATGQVATVSLHNNVDFGVPTLQVMNVDGSAYANAAVLDPTHPLHAANKGYVDGQEVPLIGASSQWVPFPFPWGECVAYRVGRLVSLTFMFQWIGATFNHGGGFGEFAVIPAGFRPRRNIMDNGRTFDGATEQGIRLEVHPDGQIGAFFPPGFQLATNVTFMAATMTYPAGG